MKKDSCVIIFSHADDVEKMEILERNLEASKKIGIPIILATHLSVSQKCQDLADYVIKDSDNLILKESDIFEEPVEFDSDLYYVHDRIQDNVIFSTSLFKKTYIPGVINLYINSFRLAHICGFKYAILLEFDFIPGEKTILSFKEVLTTMSQQNLDYFCFESFIQDLHCLHAIPSFFKVEKVIDFLPKSILKNARDYNNTTRLKIIEQWMGSKVWSNGSNGIKRDYTQLGEFTDGSEVAKIHSMLGKYLFFNLRSGVYFTDSGSLIHYTNNFSEDNIKCYLRISSSPETLVLLYQNIHEGSMNWAWFPIPQDVCHLAKTEIGVYVQETVTNLTTGESTEFGYRINNKNFGFISQLKKVSGL